MNRLLVVVAVLLSVALAAQVVDSIEPGRAFALAVDYTNDPTRPATELVLFQNGTVVTTAPAPTNGTVQFQYPQGLTTGLYNFRIIARNGTVESEEPNPTLALTVGVVDPPPPPADSPIEFEPRSCEWVVKTLAAPDTTSGWSVQFREQLSDGTFKKLGSQDSTVPYRRLTGPMTPGPHVISGIWTKSGRTPVVLPSVTRTCV